MNLRQVEAFKAVMVTGSATKAADMLFITQPAVSRLIAELEHSTKIRLFERSPNRLVPTAEAKLLYRDVERAFIALGLIKRSAEAIVKKQKGTVRVVAMPVCADSFLPRVIANFLKLHRDVHIELEVANSKTIMELVGSQQFDLGVAYMPPQDTAVTIEPFAENKAVCVLPADHRLSSREVISVHDLDGEVFVSLPLGSPFRIRIDEVFEKSRVKRRVSVETRTQLSICSLVAAGAGVSIVDPLVSANFLGPGLITRPFRPTIAWSLALLTPSTKTMSLVADEFARYVRTECM